MFYTRRLSTGAFAACARAARACGERVRRFWRRVRLLFGLARLEARRVDLRDGCPFDSSNAYDALLDPAFFRFRVLLAPFPALRVVLLTPFCAVSTPLSRRGRGGCLGFGGFDRSIRDRACSERVAMSKA